MMQVEHAPFRAPSHSLPVLIAAREHADVDVLQAALAGGGFATTVCADVESLCRLIPSAATAVIGEESLTAEMRRSLTAVLRLQPEWCDFPLIIMTWSDEPYEESRRFFEDIEGCAHPLPLQRPVRKYTLLSAVRAATRARTRQHDVRDELQQRRRAEDALREADRRKDEFLATLGHELRNPLASVAAALEVTRMTHDPSRLEKSRVIMERQISQLSRLVDDLLEVSRITRGKLELQRRPIELAAVVQSAVEDTEDAMREAAHELRVRVPDEPIVVIADPVRLGQVFANLLSNAVRYTPRGGRIELEASHAAGGVRVSVRDTGVGLASDSVETIFEMFGQVGNALDQGQRGLGIGLNLVRSLVELHDGTIQVFSEGLGLGSEFRVWLPVAAQADAPAPIASRDAGKQDQPPCRVLIAEDNEDAATTLAALVELLGHEVRVEADGAAAVEAAAQFHPDLALLDLGLPGLSGYEVARRIRGSSLSRDVVLAAVTGWGQESHQEEAKNAGFDLHLTKPLALDKLRGVLDFVTRREASDLQFLGDRVGPARAAERAPGSARHRGSGNRP